MRTDRRTGRAGAAAVAAMCASFVARCRERGVRVTPQRLAIYRALAGDPGHPTADVVYGRVRAAMPALAPGTVYRILEALVRDGLLRRVSTTGGAGRFDANLAPHQHVICRVCGRMTDVVMPGLEVGPLAGRAAPGFVVEEVDVRIVGRCRGCRPTAEGPSGPRGRGRVRRAAPVAAGARGARAGHPRIAGGRSEIDA